MPSHQQPEDVVGIRDVVGITLTALVAIFSLVLFISGAKRRARKFAKRTTFTTATTKQQ
jgi:hypothetical protein